MDVQTSRRFPGAIANSAHFATCLLATLLFSVLGPVASATSSSLLRAAPTIDSVSDFGTPGEFITVNGEGWSAGEVMIYADDSDLLVGAEPLGRAFPEGELGTFSVKLLIPYSLENSMELFACQVCSFVDGEVPYAFASLRLVPKPVEAPELVLSSGQVNSDQLVSVSGTGWSTKFSEVWIFAKRPAADEGAIPLLVVTRMVAGTFLSEPLPRLSAGDYTLFACQDCAQPDGFPFDEAALTILAAPVDPPVEPPVPPTGPEVLMSIDPNSGRTGDQVTVAGSGWRAANGKVTLFASPSDLAAGVRPLAATLPVKGGFEFTLTVPKKPARTYRFVACQNCEDATTRVQRVVRFTILPPERILDEPTLLLTPAKAIPGERVAVSGESWRPGKGRVWLFYDETDSTNRDLAVTSTPVRKGGFISASFRMPNQEAQTYAMFACQSCGDPAGFPSATRVLTIEDEPRSGPWIPLLLLVLLGALAAGGYHKFRNHPVDERAKRAGIVELPKLTAHPDVVLHFMPGDPSQRPLPVCRLIPHSDSAITEERIEVFQ